MASKGKKKEAKEKGKEREASLPEDLEQKRTKMTAGLVAPTDVRFHCAFMKKN